MGAKRRIDVMLSSTFLDLVEHREAVIAAMNGLQLTPLAQEFDAATDSDLIKESLDRVDRADVYAYLSGVYGHLAAVVPSKDLFVVITAHLPAYVDASTVSRLLIEMYVLLAASCPP